jgi:methylmalonyl-CoA mutase
MEPESLLSAFPHVPTEEWERMIREMVPGPDYAAKLIWHPEEGLAVRPYYRAEDLAGIPFLDARPGEFPFVRGTRRLGGWRIREEIDANDLRKANQSAIDAVAAGADEISFTGAQVKTQSDLSLLLANLGEVPVHIANADPPFVHLLIDRLKADPQTAGISADIDPLANIEFSAETIRNGGAGLKPFLLNAEGFQEQGAGAIEEIGFTLSMAVDFVSDMQDRSLDINSVADAIGFRFAIGPEFYTQIAKLRAFRIVWSQAIESFGCAREHAKAFIHASPCHWDKTVYDPHVNVLRSTIETLSAVLGGADSISVAPFDECRGSIIDSSRRMARNTQIILKHEALLDRVADPLGGSYLIEVLTNTIATRAWKLFQELETSGGYRKAQEGGIFASVLTRRMKAREDAVANRKCVLTGTNRFANAAENAAEFIIDSGISSHPRASWCFEELRHRTEQYARDHAHLPVVVLAEIGDVKMRNARSQFAADFLACAGFATEVHHFETSEQIAAFGADLIVLCSSDPEYLPIAGALMPLLQRERSRSKVVIAGNPETSDQLRDLGVVEFIHLRSNTIEVLTKLQKQIGMKD